MSRDKRTPISTNRRQMLRTGLSGLIACILLGTREAHLQEREIPNMPDIQKHEANLAKLEKAVACCMETPGQVDWVDQCVRFSAIARGDMPINSYLSAFDADGNEILEIENWARSLDIKNDDLQFDYFSARGVEFSSQPFKDILDELGDRSIRFCPALRNGVDFPDGHPARLYVFHIFKKIQCIDLERSEFGRNKSGRPSYWNRIVIDEAAIEGSHIWKPQYLGGEVWVSPDFVRKALEKRLRGVRFFPDYAIGAKIRAEDRVFIEAE